MKYLGLAALMCGLIVFSGIIFVGLVLTTFYIKKKRYKMDEAKWDLYFASMKPFDYFIRFWIVYVISMALCSLAGYYIFIRLGFNNPAFLAAITMLIGMGKMLVQFTTKKGKLLEKINKLNHE